MEKKNKLIIAGLLICVIVGTIFYMITNYGTIFNTDVIIKYGDECEEVYVRNSKGEYELNTTPCEIPISRNTFTLNLTGNYES